MNDDILSSFRPAIVMTLLLALLLGIGYPLLMTGIGQIAFPAQANGSLVRENGRVIGSELIAQGFAGDRYVHPRPSAAGKGYDPTASSGSNLGPASKALHDRVAGDVKTLGQNVPAELVTTSGSGLAPDIRPAGACFQAPRVARARGVSEAQVRQVIEQVQRQPLLGFIGEPRVNVLALNRALDALGRPAQAR